MLKAILNMFVEHTQLASIEHIYRWQQHSEGSVTGCDLSQD